jgi:hypothetical protein
MANPNFATSSPVSSRSTLLGAPSKKKTYDLNTQVDQFFGKYAGSPFPEAVEANEKELAEVCAY